MENTKTLKTINQLPTYQVVLEGIKKQEREDIFFGILSGRDNIVKHWVNTLKETYPKIGPVSIGIFTRDLHFILDDVYGSDFQ